MLPRHALIALLVVFAFAVPLSVATTAGPVVAASPPVLLNAQQLSSQQPDQKLVWRRTQNGWQQIPLEIPPAIQRLNLPEKRPRIHPFNVAMLTLLLALATMAWTSSEQEWLRFVGQTGSRS